MYRYIGSSRQRDVRRHYYIFICHVDDDNDKHHCYCYIEVEVKLGLMIYSTAGVNNILPTIGTEC